jgi:2'-5' RNA ligase
LKGDDSSAGSGDGDAGEPAAPPSLRLFVAFDLPEEVRAAMRRRLTKLRAQLPQSRWVDPDQAHLTLVFLGHHPEMRLAPLQAALAEVFARYPPLALRLHGGGTFPQGRPARVAWVGVKAPPEMQPLQHDVADAAAGVLDWEPEKRAFHPHVTLTRCNPTWPRAQAERFHSEVLGPWGEEFLATEGVLVRSRLSPRGAQYQALARFPLLGGGGPAGGAA